MFVDEALDLIGQSLHPAHWGSTPSYSLLPFNYASKRHILAQTEDGWKLTWEKVDLGTLRPGEVSRLSKCFSSACIALIEAAEAGYLRLYPIHVTDGVGQPLPHGVPSIQRDLITHTGSAFTSGATKGSRPATVIVLERELRSWIDSGGPRKTFEDDDAVPPSPKAIASRHIVNLIRYISEHDLKVSKEWAFRVLNAAAEKDVSQNSLVNNFWKETATHPMPIRLKLKGKASAACKQVMNSHFEPAVAAAKGSSAKARTEKPQATESL